MRSAIISGIVAAGLFLYGVASWAGEVVYVNRTNDARVREAIEEKLQVEGQVLRCGVDITKKLTDGRCVPSGQKDRAFVVQVEDYGEFCVHASLDNFTTQPFYLESGRVLKVDDVNRL